MKRLLIIFTLFISARSFGQVIQTQSNGILLSPLVDSVGQLQTLNPFHYAKVNVSGFYSVNDGGGGDFYWDDTAASTPINGIVIKISSITTGRWKRVINSQNFDLRWFGCKGDGITDNTTNMTTCFNYVASLRGVVLWPVGVFITGQQTVPSFLTILGSTRDSCMVKAAASLPNNGAVFFIHSQKNITIENVTIDGNVSAQTNATVSGIYALTDVAPVPPISYRVSNIRVINVKVKNTLSYGITTNGFLQELSDFLIEDCRFDSTGNSALRFIGTKNSTVINCTSTAYAYLNPTTAPCIAMNSIADTNISYINFTADNTGKNSEFFMEAPGSASGVCYGLHVFGCHVYGHGVGGTGISVGCQSSSFEYNFLYGGPTGAPAQRNGFEISGNNFKIIGNYISNGQIAINGQAAGFQSVPFALNGPFVIADNDITDSLSNGAGVSLTSSSLVGDTNALHDGDIHDNIINISTATSSNTAGIDTYYGSTGSGYVHGIKIHDNIIKSSFSPTGPPCIRIVRASAQHDFVIYGNRFVGYTGAMFDSSGSSNMYLLQNNTDSATIPYAIGVGSFNSGYIFSYSNADTVFNSQFPKYAGLLSGSSTSQNVVLENGFLKTIPSQASFSIGFTYGDGGGGHPIKGGDSSYTNASLIDKQILVFFLGNSGASALLQDSATWVKLGSNINYPFYRYDSAIGKLYFCNMQNALALVNNQFNVLICGGNQGGFGFSTISWSNISGIPTTISGYGITDSLTYYTTTATYAAMVSLGTPTKMTVIKVLADENKSATNTIYMWWPNGKRLWIAATADN